MLLYIYSPFYYFDPTYILIIIGLIITMWAQWRVNSNFNKYSKVRNMAGLTGAEVAERILHIEGIYDVSIEHVSGNLSDHYDPRSKVLRLSDSTYNSTSIAAAGVAAHEVGHAIQHARGYAPIRIRSVLVPVANIG
jgi:Zn-dependent membrane protease YugP